MDLLPRIDKSSCFPLTRSIQLGPYSKMKVKEYEMNIRSSFFLIRYMQILYFYRRHFFGNIFYDICNFIFLRLQICLTNVSTVQYMELASLTVASDQGLRTQRKKAHFAGQKRCAHMRCGGDAVFQSHSHALLQTLIHFSTQFCQEVEPQKQLRHSLHLL